jgi:hypothetical protein
VKLTGAAAGLAMLETGCIGIADFGSFISGALAILLSPV